MTMASDMCSNGKRRQRRSHHSTVLVTAIVVSALLAFVLLPTGHVNTSCLVQVNGLIRTVPSGIEVLDLVDASALLARPGSVLDLTGDVIALGGGPEAERAIDGRPFHENGALHDGAMVSAHHGKYAFESIKRIIQEIPYETTVEGQGAVVSLAQKGSTGEREIFKGVESGKQAALFTLKQPKNMVVERISTADSGRKLAALTFDDGPGKYTQAVLDALAAKHVPATFFVLGSCAAGNESMIAKIRAAGHEVENHSWSHPVLTKLSPGEIRNEISRTNDVIGGSRFLRPPYGSYNTTVTAEAAALGLRLVLWTVDTLDWKYPDVDSILSYVKDQTKPGAIILMHDGGNNRSATVAAIPVVVDWLFEQGYSLTTVEELL